METFIKISENIINVNNEKYEIQKTDFAAETSNIFITKDKKFIFKKVSDLLYDKKKKLTINLSDYNIFEREVYLLKILNEKVDWAPKLIYYDSKNKILMSEFSGERLNKENKPKNLKEQIKSILNDLENLNIQHNDIKYDEEILVLNNKVSICDWGWGSINNNHSCNINLWHGKKPYGITKDKDILKKIK